MVEHDHNHDHDHHHPQPGEVSLPVREEPMDPAQQSLADALRVSFSALKLVMAVLLILFLVNGVVFNVDEKEVVVVLRFGEPVAGEPHRSGLHLSLPYPIDRRVTVPMYQRSVTIDDFWLRISEKDQVKELSALPARSGGLNPEQEGALLTGDRALMHLKFTAQYRVRDDTNSPKDYVRNIPVNDRTRERDPEPLLGPILRSAAVAEAARTTANVIYGNPQRMVAQVLRRAQAELDDLRTGIELTNITADSSYFPLQVKREFLGVTTAENRKRQLIQEAFQTRQEALQGAAGPAWELLAVELQRLDQVEEIQRLGEEDVRGERDEIVGRIARILEEQATGQAGRLIQRAKSEREKIVEETKSRVQRFEILLDQYRQNPELLKTTLQKDMLAKLWEEPGVTRYLLSEDENLNVIWINPDPVERRKADQRRMEQRAGRGR